MRILATFDKCKDSLTAREICALADEVATSQTFGHECRSLPLTDGGEGFADLLTRAKGGSLHSFSAQDSLGEDREVEIGVIPGGQLSLSLREFTHLPAEGNLAVIEMSSIAGLSDLPMEKRNPWLTSTTGVGQLLEHAASLGVSAIVLGIGGSSTNDMGIGALSSLGVRFLDQDGEPKSPPNPDSWSTIENISTPELVYLPPIRIACDVSNQLLGEEGATYQFGLQKGLSDSRKNEMEKRMEKMSETLANAFNKPLHLREGEGTGAAGGIGYGLSLAYDVQFVPGFSLVSKWFDLESAIQESDLILTGEGRFDRTSLYGKGPYEIIRMASQHGKKVILLAGSVEMEAAEKCLSEFPGLEIAAFGSERLSLKENLQRAAELFKQKLDFQLSVHR